MEHLDETLWVFVEALVLLLVVFLFKSITLDSLRLAIPKSSGSLDETGGLELWGDGTSSNRNWFHIAVTRGTSGTLKGYVNGIEVISTTHSDAVDFAHGGSCNIGENAYATYAGDYPLKGHISNLRVVKVMQFIRNFTPPTSPLTVHYISENDKTVLLCCQDSDNPLQEATGKTLTGYGRHPSEPFDENGESLELVTSTGVWALTHSGTQGNFTVSENGTKLSGIINKCLHERHR